MDRDIRPQDDLYGFANGAWMKRTEIPADKSNYGTFIALADKAREDVLAIIQETAADGAPGSNEQKVADLYASVMNWRSSRSWATSRCAPHRERRHQD